MLRRLILAIALASAFFLPTATRTSAELPRSSIFGVEITRGSAHGSVNKAKEAKVTWVRYNGVLWSEVETTPGTRKMDVLKTNGVDNEIGMINEGLIPVVIIRGTPGWARKDGGQGDTCLPIAQEHFGRFASFVHEVVKRYSVPPYNVKYFEIWNEPDSPFLGVESYPFGCWGDPSDSAGYGGGYYAGLLQAVYESVKSADPEAQVLMGGLMLDCDPRSDAMCTFFDSMVKGGASSAFDIVAFHSYAYWDPLNRIDPDLENPKWQHLGGVLLGKLRFLQEYNLNKPIIMNEGGLICGSRPDGYDSPCQENELFRDAQANYVVRLYIRAWTNKMIGGLWYALNDPGWRAAGLLKSDGTPRPAYNTLKFFSATLLDGAVYSKKLFAGEPHQVELEGYEFNKGTTTTYRIYWRNKAGVSKIYLPDGTRFVYDKFGGRITPQTEDGKQYVLVTANDVNHPTAAADADPIVIEMGLSRSDTDKPIVTTASPAADATGVSVGANVTATFSEDVKSVSASTFTLIPQGSSTPVPGIVTYYSTSQTATLNPSADLAPGTTYTAALTNGITDAAGNPLEPVSWSFTTTGSAPSVPAAPTGLTATAHSKNQINLTWADNATDETGFKIERCAGAGCADFAEITPVGSNVTAYQDSGLVPGTTYAYRVRAYSGGGDSSYSNTATATTLPDSPAAPTNLTATAVSRSQINLAWKDNASNETGFKIERCSGNTCTNFVQIASVGSNVTTYSNTNLALNTSYRYRVRAHNSAGDSAYSNTASAKTPRK